MDNGQLFTEVKGKQRPTASAVVLLCGKQPKTVLFVLMEALIQLGGGHVRYSFTARRRSCALRVHRNKPPLCTSSKWVVSLKSNIAFKKKRPLIYTQVIFIYIYISSPKFSKNFVATGGEMFRDDT